VQSPDGVSAVRLRYRHVTQYEDYATIEMTRTEAPGEYAATVPGDFLTPRWDFMYFIDATDKAGHGAQWPDLAKEAPYIFVKLQR
jgi:hypothetical protein